MFTSTAYMPSDAAKLSSVSVHRAVINMVINTVIVCLIMYVFSSHPHSAYMTGYTIYGAIASFSAFHFAQDVLLINKVVDAINGYRARLNVFELDMTHSVSSTVTRTTTLEERVKALEARLDKPRNCDDDDRAFLPGYPIGRVCRPVSTPKPRAAEPLVVPKIVRATSNKRRIDEVDDIPEFDIHDGEEEGATHGEGVPVCGDNFDDQGIPTAAASDPAQ